MTMIKLQFAVMWS